MMLWISSKGLLSNRLRDFFYINGVKQCFVCHILVISFVKGQRVIFIISRFRFFLLLSAYYESGNYNLISGPIFLWSNSINNNKYKYNYIINNINL